ncbi:hypothetical protein HAX54_036851 [Datura stramonium]|uniref:Uncharacterized protein n=1 Tax=Datura stramonium TaxID=4076 RepID=A0ABS8SGH2_DATST|nr:hypothetical protein [Datura stramonium]
MLKPIDDPHVDLIATVAGPLDHKPGEKIVGNAQFRGKGDVEDPHTFVDLWYQMMTLLLKNRVLPKDYGSHGFEIWLIKSLAGATLMPFALGDQVPKSAWLVSKMGRLTTGVQYESSLKIFLDTTTH